MLLQIVQLSDITVECETIIHINQTRIVNLTSQQGYSMDISVLITGTVDSGFIANDTRHN